MTDEKTSDLEERAVEPYAMARSHSAVAGARLFEDVAGRHVRSATADLPPEVAAAEARGRGFGWENAAS